MKHAPSIRQGLSRVVLQVSLAWSLAVFGVVWVAVHQRIDEDAVRQRWTPRKSSSVWSTVNIEHVERLIAQSRMRPEGLAAYEKRTCWPSPG